MTPNYFQYLAARPMAWRVAKSNTSLNFRCPLLIGLAYATGMAVKHHVTKQQINRWRFVTPMYMQDLSDSSYTGLDFGNVKMLRSGSLGQDGS